LIAIAFHAMWVYSNAVLAVPIGRRHRICLLG
jgi:hypothetical protein